MDDNDKKKKAPSAGKPLSEDQIKSKRIDRRTVLRSVGLAGLGAGTVGVTACVPVGGITDVDNGNITDPIGLGRGRHVRAAPGLPMPIMAAISPTRSDGAADVPTTKSYCYQKTKKPPHSRGLSCVRRALCQPTWIRDGNRLGSRLASANVPPSHNKLTASWLWRLS